MKKLFTLLLTLLFVFSCFLTVNSAPGSTNYISGLYWNYGLACRMQNVNGLYVEATNLTQTYSSPVIDIASGIKEAFINNTLPTSITFKIGGKAKVVFEGNKNDSLSARLIIRAKSNMPDSNAWFQRYNAALYGDTPFFMIETTNAYRAINNKMSIKTEWTDFSTTVTISVFNALCDEIPAWDLCVDKIEIEKNPEALYFKDMFLEIVSVNNKTTLKPTPTPLVPPRVTPSQSLAPVLTPQGEKMTPMPTQDPYESTQTREEFLNQQAFKDAKDIVLLGVIGTVSVIIVSGIVSIIFKLIRKRNE